MKRGNWAIGAAVLAATSVVLAALGWWTAERMGLASDPILGWKAVAGTALGAVVFVLVCYSTMSATDAQSPRTLNSGPRFVLVVLAMPVIVYALQFIRRIEAARDGLIMSRSVTPFAIYEASLTAAASAAVVALVLSFQGVKEPLAGRRVVAVATGIALVVSAAAGTWVRYASSATWQPPKTSAAAAVARIPDALGAERYRIPITVSNWGDVIPAGNGFIVRSWSTVVGYDGSTGRVRWEVDGLSGARRSDVTWRDSTDRVGLAVFAMDRSVVALDAGTGRVVWARLMPGKVEDVVGGRGGLVVTVRDGDVRFVSLDPGSGRTVGSTQDPTRNQRAQAGDRWTVDGRTLRDLSSGVVDTLPPEVLDGARDYDVIPSGRGEFLLAIDLGDGRRRAYLRDAATHREITLPSPASGAWASGYWIGRALVLRSTSDTAVVFDPTSGATSPAALPDCDGRRTPTTLLSVPGAVLAFCGGGSSTELVGLA